MKLSTTLDYSGGFLESVKKATDLESAGIDVVWVAEAYGFDAVSLMGCLAGKTDRIQIASGILPIYTRTPALLAMTAAGIDALSNGRCVLGLGASGPQVIEGFHGIRYDKPLAAHARDHRDLSAGLEARRTGDIPRTYLPLAPPRDRGHGSR